jgi:hypothetical protein
VVINNSHTSCMSLSFRFVNAHSLLCVSAFPRGFVCMQACLHSIKIAKRHINFSTPATRPHTHTHCCVHNVVSRKLYIQTKERRTKRRMRMTRGNDGRGKNDN